MEVNIKDNVTIDTDNVYANAEPDNSGSSIGGGDIRGDSNRKVVVNIDGGTNGKVKIGDYIEIFGNMVRFPPPRSTSATMCCLK